MNEASAKSDSNQIVGAASAARVRARTRRTRLEQAEPRSLAAAGWDAGHSQRQMAAQVGVARSTTLQDGGACAALDAEVPVALWAFTLTPEGGCRGRCWRPYS